MSTDFSVLQAFMAEYGLEPSDANLPPALDSATVENMLNVAREQHGEVFSQWLNRMTREDRGARRFACISWRQARMGWNVALKGADAQKLMHVETDMEEYYSVEEQVEYLHPRVAPDGTRVLVKQMLPKSVAEHLTREKAREDRENEWKRAKVLNDSPGAMAFIKLMDSDVPEADRIEAARVLLAIKEPLPNNSQARNGSQNGNAAGVFLSPALRNCLQQLLDGELTLDDIVALDSQTEVEDAVVVDGDPAITPKIVLSALDSALRGAKTAQDTDAAIAQARGTGLIDEQTLVDAVATTARIASSEAGVWVVEKSDIRAVTLFAQRCKLSPEAADAVVDAAVAKYDEARNLLMAAPGQSSAAGRLASLAASQVSAAYENVLAGLTARGIIKPESKSWKMILEACRTGAPITSDAAVEILLMSPLVSEETLLRLAEHVAGTQWAGAVAQHKNATLAVWRRLTEGPYQASLWQALASKREVRQDSAIKTRLEVQAKDDAVVAAFLLVDKPLDVFLQGFEPLASTEGGRKALVAALEQAPIQYLGALTPELLDPFIFDRDVAIRTYAHQVLMVGASDDRYHEVIHVAPARPDFPKRTKTGEAKSGRTP